MANERHTQTEVPNPSPPAPPTILTGDAALAWQMGWSRGYIAGFQDATDPVVQSLAALEATENPI